MEEAESSSRAYALQGSPSLFRHAHFGWLCTSGLHLDYLGNTGVASNLLQCVGELKFPKR
jgi:hypothetical protein